MSNLPDLKFDDDEDKLPDLEFDDDTPEAPAPKTDAPEEISKLETLGRTFAGGFTGGLNRKLTAGAGTIKDVLLRDDLDLKDFPEVYQSWKDVLKRRDDKAEAANPKTAVAGHLTGNIAMGLIPGLALSKGAKAGEIIGKSALGGAISGFGESEGKDLADVAKDTLAGAGVGAALGKVGSELGELGQSLGGKARGFAEERAVKALSPILSQQELLSSKGAAKELGGELLDEGVTGFGRSVKGMLPRVEKLLSEKGSEIGKIRDSADDVIRAAGPDGVGPIDFGRLSKMGSAKEAFSDATNEATQRTARAYSRNADSLAKVPQRTISEAQGEVQALSEQIPFNKAYAERSPTQQALTDLRRDIVGQIDDKVRQVSPEDADKLAALKKQFGLFKDAEGVLDKAVAKKAVHRDLSLTDYLAALQGGDSHSVEGGLKKVALAAGNKLARERGNSVLASTANKVSQLLQSDPKALGKFAAPLTAAAQRGNKAVMATHAILMQDPEYRSLVGEDEGVE
jgi:hypothetical protein